MARRLLLLAILSCIFSFAPCPDALAVRPDGIGPQICDVSKSICLPGQTVNFMVGLSGEASGDEVLSVSYSSGAFTSIPTELHPSAGQTSISFAGNLSSLYAGLVSVTVSGNGHSATTTFFVIAIPL
jgi:hypothetical protein